MLQLMLLGRGKNVTAVVELGVVDGEGEGEGVAGRRANWSVWTARLRAPRGKRRKTRGSCILLMVDGSCECVNLDVVLVIG